MQHFITKAIVTEFITIKTTIVIKLEVTVAIGFVL